MTDTADQSTLLHRFTASDDDLDAESLRKSSMLCGATAAGDCSRGELVDLYGRLRVVTHIPGGLNGATPTVEAELFDGTGSVTLIWLGRSVIAGIVAGRQLRVRGRIAVREGRRVIYNPNYTLEAGAP
ncbi:MAG: OB-fold nucleic acid binding domain-containing protein [Pseudonocardiaceae bacterium]